LAQDSAVPATATANAGAAAGEVKPDHSFWLYDGEQKIRLLETAQQLRRRYAADRMKGWPVSDRVGNVRNNGPELLDVLS